MLTVNTSLALLVAWLPLQSCTAPQVTPQPARATISPVPDAVATNPENYTVVLENDRVRILEYKDRPGEKTAVHHHPDFVLVVVSPFKRKITLPDGSSREREFRAGEVLSMKAETHVGENIGTTETHALLVELK